MKKTMKANHRDDSRMKMTRRLLTSAIAGVLLFVGVSPAAAAPKIIEQSAVLELTPKDLRFENMVVGVPQTQTVTVNNISGRTLNITPSIKLDNGYGTFLSSSMKVCSGGSCSDSSSMENLSLPKDSNYELQVTLTLTSALPTELNGAPLEGGIEVRGEVLPEAPGEEVIVIVPDEVAESLPDDVKDSALKPSDKDGGLAETGVSSLTFILLIIGVTTLILGFVLVRVRGSEKDETQSTLS